MAGTVDPDAGSGSTVPATSLLAAAGLDRAAQVRLAAVVADGQHLRVDRCLTEVARGLQQPVLAADQVDGDLARARRSADADQPALREWIERSAAQLGAGLGDYMRRPGVA
jgi:hypothetical protein